MRVLIAILFLPTFLFAQETFKSKVFEGLELTIDKDVITMRQTSVFDILPEGVMRSSDRSVYYLVDEIPQIGMYQTYYVLEDEMMDTHDGDVVDNLKSVQFFSKGFGARFDGDLVYILDFQKARIDTVELFDPVSGDVGESLISQVEGISHSAVLKKKKTLIENQSIVTPTGEDAFLAILFGDVQASDYSNWKVTHYRGSKSTELTLDQLMKDPAELLSIYVGEELVDVEMAELNKEQNLSDWLNLDHFYWARDKDGNNMLYSGNLNGIQEVFSGKRGLVLTDHFAEMTEWYVINEDGIHFDSSYVSGYSADLGSQSDWIFVVPGPNGVVVSESPEGPDYEELRKQGDTLVYNRSFLLIEFDLETGEMYEITVDTGAIINWRTGDVLLRGENLHVHGEVVYERIGQEDFRVLNKNGKLICEAESVDYFDETAIVVTLKSGEYGLLDKRGQWVLPPQSDRIIAAGDYLLLEAPLGMEDDWYYDFAEPNYRICDRDGKVLVDSNQFRDENWRVLSFDEGVFVFTRNNLTGIAKPDGEVMVEPLIEEYWDVNEMGVLLRYRVGDKWGLVDFSGNIVAEPSYSDEEIYTIAEEYIEKLERE